MARRIIIDNILRLIQNIGGNPKNFMGTRTNINFLGKGPNQPLLEGPLDRRVLDVFPREQIVSEAERAGGYVAANKLNDLQLQRLQNNLIEIDKIYNPPANITDMATRTGGLSEKGLGSLRQQETFKDFLTPERSNQLKAAIDASAAESAAMRKAGLDPSKQADFFKWEEIKKSRGIGNFADDLEAAEYSEGIETSGLMTRINERMKKIKKLSDELGKVSKGEPTKAGTFEVLDPTAAKTSYISKFNPKNEVHVQKAEALLKDPQIKGLYTEAEVKNAYDFEGLYQSHFDKGHVDVARFFEMAGGHNIPQMRASARDALLTLMKKRGQTGSGLRDFVDEVDFKYITEGGGGRAGDPINLFVKYFGKNAAENLPKNATKENMEKFTDFIVAAKDRRGRGIDDPFFDRESIDFSTLTGIVDDIPPFASGGRVGLKMGGLGEILQVPRTSFRWGSGLSKALLRRINKKVIKDAVDDIFPTGDYKMDAELAAEALVENNPKLFGGKLIDDLDDAARSDIYGLVLGEVSTRFGLNLKKQRGIKSLIKGVDEQFGEGTLKRASELPKGTKYETLEAVKDFEARNRTFKLNIEKFMQEFGVSRDEATRISLLPAEEQQAIIQRYINANMAKRTQALGGGEDLSGVSPNYAERYTDELLKDWNPGKGRKPNASGGLAKILEV